MEVSSEGEEFNLANGFNCDCSDPENFGFEDQFWCTHLNAEEIDGAPEAVEYFMDLLCGDAEPHQFPPVGPSCYLYNYERFAHHEAGPDDGNVPTIFPEGTQFDDDFMYGYAVCIMTEEGQEVDREENGIPCDCSNPREFMKNMLNEGMFLRIS